MGINALKIMPPQRVKMPVRGIAAQGIVSFICVALYGIFFIGSLSGAKVVNYFKTNRR
jgi:hypothetical protein